MPYVSDEQRRFFHSPGAKKAGITAKQVKEYDKASKGKDLPERIKSKKKKAKKELQPGDMFNKYQQKKHAKR